MAAYLRGAEITSDVGEIDRAVVLRNAWEATKGARKLTGTDLHGAVPAARKKLLKR